MVINKQNKNDENEQTKSKMKNKINQQIFDFDKLNQYFTVNVDNIKQYRPPKTVRNKYDGKVNYELINNFFTDPDKKIIYHRPSINDTEVRLLGNCEKFWVQEGSYQGVTKKTNKGRIIPDHHANFLLETNKEFTDLNKAKQYFKNYLLEANSVNILKIQTKTNNLIKTQTASCIGSMPNAHKQINLFSIQNDTSHPTNYLFEIDQFNQSDLGQANVNFNVLNQNFEKIKLTNLEIKDNLTKQEKRFLTTHNI